MEYERSLIEQITKREEEIKKQEEQQRASKLLMKQEIPAEYRNPTLIERIESLERKVKHLIDLLGAKV